MAFTSQETQDSAHILVLECLSKPCSYNPLSCLRASAPGSPTGLATRCPPRAQLACLQKVFRPPIPPNSHTKGMQRDHISGRSCFPTRAHRGCCTCRNPKGKYVRLKKIRDTSFSSVLQWEQLQSARKVLRACLYLWVPLSITRWPWSGQCWPSHPAGVAP